MRVHALLSFYDEPMHLLAACIDGLAKAGVDHLIALDGRYALYEADEDVSDVNQHGAIVTCCRNAGMACTLSVPNGAWQGGEVEKRTALFALAWTLADEGDWFWVQDADQIVRDAPRDWKDQLAATDLDVAHVTLHDVVAAELDGDQWPAEIEMRSLFRAQPIHLETNHCTYVTEDGRLLWDMGIDEEPSYDLSAIRVDHCPQQRAPERLAAKLKYYTDRDASGIERGTCVCGERAVRLVARNWKMSAVEGRAVAEWHEACERHAKRWEYEGLWEMRRMGLDPSTVHNRNGARPEVVTT